MLLIFIVVYNALFGAAVRAVVRPAVRPERAVARAPPLRRCPRAREMQAGADENRTEEDGRCAVPPARSLAVKHGAEGSVPRRLWPPGRDWTVAST